MGRLAEKLNVEKYISTAALAVGLQGTNEGNPGVSDWEAPNTYDCIVV